VTWNSNNTLIATVSQTGLVTGTGPGTTNITATSEGKTGSTTLTVSVAPVATVTVTPSSATILTGQTQQLTATMKDLLGNTLTGRSVTWSTSDPSVATVSPSGLVTGVDAGSVTITATSEGKTGTATITVMLAPVATVTVSPASFSVARNSAKTLTATLRDAAGNVLTGRSIVWVSSDTTIATVDQSGVVRGVKEGSATITATSEGKSGSSSATVTK
jgi:uncharacterized protein YjdB